MKGQYTSIQRIFSNMGKFIQSRGIAESDIIDWTGQALDAMKLSTVFQPAVKIAIVENYQTKIPRFTHAIVQIARNNNWDIDQLTTEQIVESVGDTTVDIPVALDENGMPVNAYDLAYYRPFPDFEGDYFTVGSLSIRKRQFTPVRLANHSFFNSLVCKEKDFDGIYKTCKDEYTVVENLLRFSFPSGQIMISYLKQALDSDGYPIIPDDYSAIQAIEKYIHYKVAEEEYYDNRQGSDSRYQKAEADWQWYCAQAKNEDKLPQTVDEWQNLIDMRRHLIPQNNRYYGFFGALSHPEHLKF